MGPEAQNMHNQNPNTPQTPPPTSIQDFEIIKELGQGTFAIVYLAKRILNQKHYAIKVIKKQQVLQQNELEHTIQELKILQLLDHPFLIHLHGAFQTSENLYLVLDLMQGGELFHHIKLKKQFSEKQAMYWVAQIIMALQFLHNNKVIMRDLKPENILLDFEGYIKITDFGLSKISKDNQHVQGTTFCGTAEYLSPEQLRNQPHGVEVDFWALGCICYELISGIPPFYNKDHKTMFKQIIRMDPKFSEDFSLPCQQFIKECLQKNPQKRLGFQGHTENLKSHPWFAILDWDKLYNRQIEMDYKPQQHVNSKNCGVDLGNFDVFFTNQTIDQKEVFDIDNTVQDADKFTGFDIDSKLADKMVQQKLQGAEKMNNQYQDQQAAQELSNLMKNEKSESLNKSQKVETQNKEQNQNKNNDIQQNSAQIEQSRNIEQKQVKIPNQPVNNEPSKEEQYDDQQNIIPQTQDKIPRQDTEGFVHQIQPIDSQQVATDEFVDHRMKREANDESSEEV